MKPFVIFLPGLLLLPMHRIASAQTAQPAYPDKTVRLVVGFLPGGQPDTVARLMGQKLSDALGKPVVIDNITGAAGSIAAERVAKAAADGYTLGVLAQPQLVVNPGLYRVAYDPIKDFAPASQWVVSPYMLFVHNGVAAKSVKELVALAKAQPGVLTFASSGTGSASHLSAALFMGVAGIDVRSIPYKGVTGAMPDLLGGRVTLSFFPMSVGLPLARDGKLRALAVTALKRAAVAPDLPTIAESGYPGFESSSWIGLLAPAGTPTLIVRRLHRESVAALALVDLRAKFTDLGLETIGNSPDEFSAVIQSDIPKWSKVIRDAGLKAE